MLPECPRRHLADLFPNPFSSSKPVICPEKGQKKWYALGEFTQFAIFHSKCRKSIISASVNAHHGTKSHAFFLRKMGKKWAKSVFYGEKMGKFFEGGIFVIRQRADHHDRLFEPPDMILYHENSVIQGRIHAEREKNYPMRFYVDSLQATGCRTREMNQ